MRPIPAVSEWRFRAKAFWAQSVTNKLIVICAAVFVAQTLNLFFAEVFTLNLAWLKQGFLLNFLTYGFLHGGIWHLVLNGLALYFAGNAVERYYSRGVVLPVFLGGTIFGGLFWMACVAGFAANPVAHTLVGASAGISALFAFFSIDNRTSEIRAMLFFVLPLKMPAWMIFALLGGFSLLGLLFGEIPAMRNGGNASVTQSIAHSAHLGGLLFGGAFALIAERWQARFGNVRYFRR